MLKRHVLVAAAFAALAWTAVSGAGTQTPSTRFARSGQAVAAGQGRGGRGGGANFPQQQRPPGDAAVIARGRALYGVHCTACHGGDLRGGDQGGPNLLRSSIILDDQQGEDILPVIRDGRRGPVGTMPAFALPESDILAIVEYIHSVMGQAGRQGRPPERETPIELSVLVGDAAAGQVYFARACSRCHSPTGDLQGIAARVADPRALQNLWVSGASGRGASTPLGAGGGRGGSDAEGSRVMVTVTVPASAPVTGQLVRIDDFVVTLIQPDGVRRTFRREGAVPKVDVNDPLEPHRRLVLELTDRDMHNVTAYLATLK
jgi:cytochrome c oxidase cbb3-type subunit 3